MEAGRKRRPTKTRTKVLPEEVTLTLGVPSVAGRCGSEGGCREDECFLEDLGSDMPRR